MRAVLRIWSALCLLLLLAHPAWAAAPTGRGVVAPIAGLVSTSPADTAIDDLVVVVTWERAGAGIPTHTLQSTFVEIRSQPHEDGSTDGRLSVAYKIATAAGAQSYQAYTSSVGTETWTGMFVLVAGTYSVASLPPSAGVTQTTNAVPNPPLVSGLDAAKDYLGVAIAAWHLGSSLTLTPTAPTTPSPGLTLRWDVAGAATGDVALATIDGTDAGLTSFDPGTFGDNQAPNGTSAITIAFVEAPAVGGATPQRSLMGVGT